METDRRLSVSVGRVNKIKGKSHYQVVWQGADGVSPALYLYVAAEIYSPDIHRIRLILRVCAALHPTRIWYPSNCRWCCYKTRMPATRAQVRLETWRRYSEFEKLSSALNTVLGAKMAEVVSDLSAFSSRQQPALRSHPRFVHVRCVRN